MSSYADVTPGEIQARLAAVAAEEGMVPLLAVESGSRAWGFASPDSDWDIRFVYRLPLEGYLTVEPRRDVVERPIDARGIDLSGWDLRKALGLLMASNPALLEWLQSPITYADDGRFRPAALALFEAHASRRALAHHYRSIAVTHWRRSFEGEETVKLKRYFYIVRSVAALAWVARTDRLPPMTLDDLLAGVDLPADTAEALDELRLLKTTLPEFGTGPRRAALDRYITATLDAVDPAAIDDRAGLRPAFRAEVDALFRGLLGVRPAPADASRPAADERSSMPQQITTGYKALLTAAEAEIETLGVEAAAALVGRDDTVFVDLRDPRELEREGRMPGAFHCPRGMLEFWIDPASPYHKPIFQADKRFVFFCGGGWRSALAAKAAQDMGLKPVAHVEGGFSAWKAAGKPVEAPAERPPRGG